jgi:hypothetical protein
VDPAWPLSGIRALLTEAAVIAGVMYYFGWARAQRTYEYFGIDVSWLELSTTDFVMRSLAPLFRPVMILCLIAVVLAYLHGGVRRLLDRRRLVIGLRCVAAVLAVVVVLSYASDRFGSLVGDFLPLAVSGAAASLGYSDYLGPAAAAQRARVLAAAALCLIGVLWAVSLYAVEVGDKVAAAIVADAPHKPDIIVYSERRLAISGPGVIADEIPGAASRYHFRYSGLRILVRTKDRFVLIPAAWQRGRDLVFFVADDDQTRIDVRT